METVTATETLRPEFSGQFANRNASGSAVDHAISIDETGRLPAALQLVLDARHALQQGIHNLLGGNLTQTVTSIVDLIKQANLSDPGAVLASVILCRAGRYSIVHAVSTAILTEQVARRSGYLEEDIDTAVAAALTMNVSIFAIQDQLQTLEQPLTDHQRTLIRQHPIASVQLLKAAQVSHEEWLNTILHHHEAHDGSGYPFGRRGENIPRLARLIHMADIYCARVVPRNYRRAIPGAQALRSLLLERGHAISARLAAHFMRVVGLYPPGSMVELANGEIAMVVCVTDQPAAPFVKSLTNAEGELLAIPLPRDTIDATYRIVQACDPYRMDLAINPQLFWPD